MPAPDIEIREGNASLSGAFDVRTRVFVEEQGVPEHLELDDKDAEATHAVACAGDEAVGTARFREIDDVTGKIERVAVLPSHRNSGLGRRLMETLESVARDRGVERIVLHAQKDTEEFYWKLGYATTSDVFEEAGMPHVEMEKHLA